MQRLPQSLLVIAVFLLSGAPIIAGDELDLPPEKIADSAPGEMMHRYLLRQVNQAAEQWKENYEKRKTPAEIAAYQKRMREKCLEAIGRLPRRTPLNPQVIGTVSRPGYRVEKVLFQSQPMHFVTALLFLPDPERFQPPYPGVLIPCGHALEAKGYPTYQTMGALLALNGMAALAFDPIDQGERGQYLGQEGWPELWGTKAHSMVGIGCILLGRNTARFEIWDGMRAIDYLQSRPEVDPRRGCTGNSGGGTQTSYLMALDNRIRVAAPSCFLTSFPRLLETIGPQDAEQNIFGQLAFGADHADWIMMRAPSPVLICAATKDFFDIGGTGRRAAAWAKEDKVALLDRVRQLSGIRKLSELPRPEVEAADEVARTGYNIEKLLIRSEEGVSLPALLFLPEKPTSDRVVLYVHQQGKSADAKPGGPIKKLVLAGQAVLAVDLRGTGQTAPTGKGKYSLQWREASLAYLLGRSYVGMRAEDILLCAQYAAGRFADGQPGSVDLVAVGNVGVSALHAAALEPQLFHTVQISRSLRAWANIIHQRLSRDQMVNTVHGALTHYDLPDLAAALAEKITIEQPVDAGVRQIRNHTS